MNELPKTPDVLAPKSVKMQQKMQALRLSAALQDLHDKAHDRSLPEADGVAAAQAMAMSMLKHFDLIVYALRVAGGARRP